MKSAVDWIVAHWPVILPLLMLLVNDLRNALARYPKVDTALEIVGDLLSWHERKDSPGTLKLPFRRSVNPNGIAPPSPPGSSARVFIPFLMIGMTGLGACSYCAQVAHQKEARCVAQAVASKCGEPAIAKLVIQLLPQVVGDLVSGDYSALLGNLIQTLEQQGVADAAGLVTCAVQSVDGNLPSMSHAAPNPNLVAAKEHAQAWLAAHR